MVIEPYLDAELNKYMTITSKVKLNNDTDAVVAIDIDMESKKFQDIMSHDLDKTQYKSWFLAHPNY